MWNKLRKLKGLFHFTIDRYTIAEPIDNLEDGVLLFYHINGAHENTLLAAIKNPRIDVD